jgi:pimeloyl-ACP methyl ester carboxylesterase
MESSMLFKNMEVNGLNIFYREAGKQTAPKLVLLHGFPASSHQYRNLIPALAEDFHVIAPDYPGIGNSDMPDPKTLTYTFDNTSEIIESFLEKMGFTRFGLYLQDYGGPVGFRIVTRRPDWLEWLNIQNTNALRSWLHARLGQSARCVLEEPDAGDREAARSIPRARDGQARLHPRPSDARAHQPGQLEHGPALSRSP